MTFPLKESLIYFEDLHGLQRRIYDDAADFGVKIDEAAKIEARQHLTAMIKFYGAKITRWSKITRWGDSTRSHGSNTQIFIPIEHDVGGLAGYVLDVSFNRDSARDVEFLSIEIQHTMLTKSVAADKYNSKVAA